MKHRAVSSAALAAVLVCLSISAVAQAPAKRRGARRPATKAGSQVPAQWGKSFQWRSLGPATMGGRITRLAVYEKDPTRFWAATASGGLLKTTNNGITFEHQFDHEATVSIGAVAVAPSNPEIVWVGTGEGNPRNSVSYGDGVYKSVDGGKTWKNMGLRKSFQIGDIVIHPTNPDVVWVAALGRLYGPNEERGLYKTSDGGKTWECTLSIDAKTGVSDIALQPSNPDVLLVSAYERQRDGFDTNAPVKKIAPGSGVYRSTDGGETFEEIRAGLPSCDLGRVGFDWYRKDPDVVFATVESAKSGMAGERVGWHGVQAKDAETGARVTAVAKDSPAAKAGLEKDDIVLEVAGKRVLSNHAFLVELARFEIGEAVVLEYARKGESHKARLVLAARPKAKKKPESARRRRRQADPNLPFSTFLGGQVANVQDLQGRDGSEHGGIYRSADAGRSWKRVNSYDPRPMYFSVVRVDPSDEKYLYILGVSMARSKDGGHKITLDAGRGVHADQHAMWIDPDNGRHMIVGCDGGLYVTYDRCAKWEHLNHMALGQFYHVAVGPRRDYWVYGGLQDNGTWGAPHRDAHGSGPINESWLRVGGGDGFVVRVDPLDPDQIYYESQNGGMRRTNLRTMAGGSIRPRRPRSKASKASKGKKRKSAPPYRFNWKTPFLLSHHNSRIYYCAGNHVFRSIQQGDSLKEISPDITRTKRGSATALAESPRDAGVLYVGTDDGALHGTRDGGRTWTDLFGATRDVTTADAVVTTDDDDTPEERIHGPHVADAATEEPAATLASLVPGPRWVSSIEASRYAAGRVYVTLDAHRSDDDAPYVFVSEDYGATWKALSDSLPRGSTRVLREDRSRENLLYLGTEFGFWVSLDRGAHWMRCHGANLPTVAIHEVAQHQTEGDIVLATHGRSLWALDATPLRELAKDGAISKPSLLTPSKVVRWVTRSRHGSSGGAKHFTGQGPTDQAEIFYLLPAAARGVQLSVHDLSGKLLHTFEAKTEAGLHRITWNLRREATAADRAKREAQLKKRFGDGWKRFLRFFRNRQPMVADGTYEVRMTVAGKTQTTKLTIEPDPTVSAEAAQNRRFEVELERAMGG